MRDGRVVHGSICISERIPIRTHPHRASAIVVVTVKPIGARRRENAARHTARLVPGHCAHAVRCGQSGRVEHNARGCRGPGEIGHAARGAEVVGRIGALHNVHQRGAPSLAALINPRGSVERRHIKPGGQTECWVEEGGRRRRRRCAAPGKGSRDQEKDCQSKTHSQRLVVRLEAVTRSSGAPAFAVGSNEAGEAVVCTPRWVSEEVRRGRKRSVPLVYEGELQSVRRCESLPVVAEARLKARLAHQMLSCRNSALTSLSAAPRPCTTVHA